MIRQFVCDYLEIEKDFFKPFISGGLSIEKYIENMRKDKVWGDDLEIQIISEIYDVKIQIFSTSWTPIKTFNENPIENAKCIRLLYLQFSHYETIHDKVRIEI